MVIAIGGVHSVTTATTTSCEAPAVSPAERPVRLSDFIHRM